jgi:galactose mutarotase-like enzyme
VELPEMRRLALDLRAIPTGVEEAFGAVDEILGARAFDDGFALSSDSCAFRVSGGGLRISVEPLAGFPFAQVYAPPGEEFIALEPMAAPTSALTSGRELRLVEPGGTLQAAFRIRVEG